MISPDEIEYLAENDMISVVPNFRHERMYLISGDVGPFEPALPVPVPVWLAVNLRARSKCRLVPPDWMDVQRLTECKDQEAASAHFTALPSAHYMELTQLVLDTAPDDVPHADAIRTLVKDIWDLRLAKLRSSIDAFLKSNSSFAKLDNLTLLELNTARPLLNHSMDQLYRLKRDTYRNVMAATNQQNSTL